MIPIEIPTDSFVKIDKLILNLAWKMKKSRQLKIVLKKKFGGFHHYNLDSVVLVERTVNRAQNRIERPEPK